MICTINLKAPAPPKKGFPIYPLTFGDYLKRKRLEEGLTQTQVADELKVYTSTIDKWERMRIKPNKKSKEKIIQFLGFDPMK